jgi:predicted MPP superfamily phosphohydrolase
MKQRKNTILPVLAAVLVFLVVYIAWGNTALEQNSYLICSDRVPSAFSGFRIAQISDLHNAEFGEENAELLKLLRASSPDIIVITGDLVDSYHTDLEISLDFASEAMKIAPCYYVTGNHEARISGYGALKAGLEASGVVVLENEIVNLERCEETISLAGAMDPSFRKGSIINELHAGETYTILLSHRPELFDSYAAAGVDLVFTGHAHGGQFRLPVVGGLLAPNQGLFPRYDAGIYTEGRTNMLVSRGIGNSIFPFRFNNPPEIILVTLKQG